MEEGHGGGQEEAGTGIFQRKYLRQLGALLRRLRFERATSVWGRSRVVKLAADLSMAMTTRGGTQWNRAIVRQYLSRLKKTRGQKRVFKCGRNSQKMRSVSVKAKPCKTIADNGILSHSDEEERTVASGIQSLRLLVPGSQRLDTPLLLEETAGYIVALKMQVQAMHALANCYTNSSAHAPC